MFNLKTKVGKAYQAIVVDGRSLTPAQAKKEFKIENLRAEVTRIRQSGFAIHTNKTKAKNGKVVSTYRHGKATREVIAAGYKALAKGLV